MAKRRVELPTAINSVETIKAGLVKIDCSRRCFDGRELIIILATHRIEHFFSIYVSFEN